MTFSENVQYIVGKICFLFAFSLQTYCCLIWIVYSTKLPFYETLITWKLYASDNYTILISTGGVDRHPLEYFFEDVGWSIVTVSGEFFRSMTLNSLREAIQSRSSIWSQLAGASSLAEREKIQLLEQSSWERMIPHYGMQVKNNNRE